MSIGYYFEVLFQEKSTYKKILELYNNKKQPTVATMHYYSFFNIKKNLKKMLLTEKMGWID